MQRLLKERNITAADGRMNMNIYRAHKWTMEQENRLEIFRPA
jgi:hypothetical protein